MSPWFLAARPKTLVAGAIPVVMGSSLAVRLGTFQWGVLVAALLGSLSIQVATNYVNDAADFERGADTKDRLGPPRMAASGILSPRALYRASIAWFVLAFLAGSYLIIAAGPPILIIGIFSIVFAVAYTAGPFPLAYLGLGDLFVLIFFGLVAVLGTVFSHGREITAEAWWLAFSTGFHAVALIAVNNLRDIPTDQLAGKRTLSLRLGEQRAKQYYAALLFLPYLCWLPIALRLPLWAAALPLLSLPIAIKNARRCFTITERRDFNVLLGKTAALQLLFGALASFALAVAR